MSKFRYTVAQWHEPEENLAGYWEAISTAEGEPQIVAIGLRATADLLSPPPTVADAWADLKATFKDAFKEFDSEGFSHLRSVRKDTTDGVPGYEGGTYHAPNTPPSVDISDPYDSFKGGVSDADEFRA